MKVLVTLILNGLAVFMTSELLPGISVDNFWTAIVVAVVLGIVNTFLKPLLIILTLPINIVTLGLFVFVINAVLVILVGMFVPGFVVESFIWALIFSLVLSLVNSFFHKLSK